MTKVGVILQARMSSQRLPGKVLCKVNGKPLLAYTLERLAHCQTPDQIIVATSDDPSDDPVAKFCESYGVNCYRGALSDVAGRFVSAVVHYQLEACVRVNGDSPLLDHQLIDKGVAVYRDGDFDLVTNVFPRTYPKGFSVEVIRATAIQQAYLAMTTAVEREHVTPYFYHHPEMFHIQNFSFSKDYSDRQLSVDTKDDFKLFEKIVSSMNKPHWQYTLEEIMALADSAHL